MKKFVAAMVIISFFLLTPFNAQAEGTLSNVGYGLGAAFSSCVYSPVKVVYALAGALTGGIAYGLTVGNRDVADSIWVPSLRGDYVITPDMLKGTETVEFVGRPE